MTPAPRVSVIMAVYNGGRYLREAIDSVLSQDFGDFEFVIVDDCSTDDTAAIVASYRDPRVVYLLNPRNLGQTPSLNRALQASRGDYIGRIDADDAYRPGKLARQVAYLDAHPDVAVCGTAAVKIDGEGRDFGAYTPPVRRQDIEFAIHYRTPVCHVSVLMRRAAVVACGGYDERYKYAADYALWSSLLTRGQRIANLGEPLMKYREFRESLGAVHKLGTAGAESAGIIAANARALAGLTLSSEEARDLALLFFPAAGLSARAISRAHTNLSRLAASVYRRVPWRVTLQLRAILFWSFLKTALHEDAATQARHGRRDLLNEAGRSLAHPGVLLPAIAAWLLSFAGERRILRWKDAALPRVLRSLR